MTVCCLVVLITLVYHLHNVSSAVVIKVQCTEGLEIGTDPSFEVKCISRRSHHDLRQGDEDKDDIPINMPHEPSAAMKNESNFWIPLKENTEQNELKVPPKRKNKKKLTKKKSKNITASDTSPQNGNVVSQYQSSQQQTGNGKKTQVQQTVTHTQDGKKIIHEIHTIQHGEEDESGFDQGLGGITYPGTKHFFPVNVGFPQSNNRFPSINKGFSHIHNGFRPVNNMFPPVNNIFPPANNRLFPSSNGFRPINKVFNNRPFQGLGGVYPKIGQTALRNFAEIEKFT